MAALNYAPATHGTFGLFGRAHTLISALTALIVAKRDAAETRKTLSALSDRELSDIGLCRGDIELIACGNKHF